MNSLKNALAQYLDDVAHLVGGSVPKALRADMFKVETTGRNYACVTAKGYSRSDLEAETTIALTIDYQPIRVRAFISYKDALMTKAMEVELTLDYTDDPEVLKTAIEGHLRNL